jgi:NAD(P)-dependent dehydrogenase (short-subunit alcohol dehydrogenase family)
MKENLFDLKQVTCVVAGANGLLGNSCVHALIKSGATVIGLDLEVKKAEATHVYSVDITNEAQVIAFFQEFSQGIVETESWAFVNCSYPRTPHWGTLNFENISQKDWDDNVRLQLGSSFVFTREAVKFLKTRKGGSIVNFSSIYGLVGPDMKIYEGTSMVNPAPYASIKSGIIGLTRYVATVYGSYDIRANVLCPGGIQNEQPESFIKAYEAKTPLGRMGTPEDIAGVVAFLVGPAAKYLNGAVIPVDGGFTVW